MFQPKLRRALAVLTLTFAATLAAASGASAAVHPRTARPAHVRAVETPVFSWLRRIVVRVLEKAQSGEVGVRIDPDGHQ